MSFTLPFGDLGFKRLIIYKYMYIKFKIWYTHLRKLVYMLLLLAHFARVDTGGRWLPACTPPKLPAHMSPLFKTSHPWE